MRWNERCTGGMIVVRSDEMYDSSLCMFVCHSQVHYIISRMHPYISTLLAALDVPLFVVRIWYIRMYVVPGTHTHTCFMLGAAILWVSCAAAAAADNGKILLKNRCTCIHQFVYLLSSSDTHYGQLYDSSVLCIYMTCCCCTDEEGVSIKHDLLSLAVSELTYLKYHMLICTS